MLLDALAWVLVRIPLLGWHGIAAGIGAVLLGASANLAIWTAIATAPAAWTARWAYDSRTGGPTLHDRYLERLFPRARV